MVADHRRDDVIQRGQIADDSHRRLHMALHLLILLFGKPAVLVQHRFRNADLADVVQKGRLPHDLDHVRVQARGLCQRGGVVGHIVGVVEGVVILGVDGGHQSQHRLLVALIDVGMIHLFGPAVRLAQHRLENLDAVFAAVLHMVHRHVGVVHQLPAGGRVEGGGADADA